jgi:threonine dehydrogenase-like Zn-dependent dehydrogenase
MEAMHCSVINKTFGWLPRGSPVANQVSLPRILAFGRGQIMEKIPSQMTVVAISKPGGPEVLLPETRAVPQPGSNEILIKVMAAGVNRPDVAQRAGVYPPPPGASDLPGLEVAGEVVALGDGSHKHKIGDKVMSLVAGGGYDLDQDFASCRHRHRAGFGQKHLGATGLADADDGHLRG